MRVRGGAGDAGSKAPEQPLCPPRVTARYSSRCLAVNCCYPRFVRSDERVEPAPADHLETFPPAALLQQGRLLYRWIGSSPPFSMQYAESRHDHNRDIETRASPAMEILY